MTTVLKACSAPGSLKCVSFPKTLRGTFKHQATGPERTKALLEASPWPPRTHMGSCRVPGSHTPKPRMAASSRWAQQKDTSSVLLLLAPSLET